MDTNALFSLSYGLFVVGAAQGGKWNGMIGNTLMQATSSPLRVTLTLAKGGLTHDMVLATGRFSASVLCKGVDFALFRHFGFQSGRDCEKFGGAYPWELDSQGLPYLTEMACARFSCRVARSADLGTHTWFLADVLDAACLQSAPPVTYADYHREIKPKPEAPAPQKTGLRRWQCKICGYIYEGESLPGDFTCPLCSHGAADFEEI
ncbi:MAG: flavin reductase [Oscillospiraceae bacterium]|jgi:flavin reductase (DIM6/NTAB) family NADH-FMN oxidoreductase RutF/rubredoxin|nr:flavin reductase [Oscillospiraceae bacterium]